MNTVKKAAVLTAAACAMVMSGAGVASADGGSGASAEAAAIGSPGILSGNVFQLPINMPINNCGNSIGLFGFLNPAFGNTCINATSRGEHRFRRHHAFRGHLWCEYGDFGWRDGHHGHHGRRCGREGFEGREGRWGFDGREGRGGFDGRDGRGPWFGEHDHDWH